MLEVQSVVACVAIHKRSPDLSSVGAGWYIYIGIDSWHCAHCRRVLREWRRGSDRFSLWLTVCFQISSQWQHSCRTWTPAWPVPRTRWRKVLSPRPQSLRRQQKKGWAAQDTLMIQDSARGNTSHDQDQPHQVTASDSPINWLASQIIITCYNV